MTKADNINEELSTEIVMDDEFIPEEILSEIGQSSDDDKWLIRVYRVGAKTDAFLFECDYAQFTGVNTKLLEEYGTGLYRIRVYQNGRLRFKPTIAVERPPTPARDTTAAPSNDLAAILQAMASASQAAADRMDRILERLLEKPEPRAPAAPDPFQMLERVSTIFANMQRTNQPQSGAADTSSTLELVTKVFELAQNVSGESRERGMMDVLGDLIKSPLLGKLMEGASHMQLQPPSPTPTATPQRQPAQPQQPQQPQSNPFGDAIVYLIGRAQVNANPELYAEWLLDNVPRDLLDKLLPQQNLVMQLEQAIPAIVPHRIWFQMLIDEVRAIVESEQSPPEGQSADAANVVDGRTGGTDTDARNPQAHAATDARG